MPTCTEKPQRQRLDAFRNALIYHGYDVRDELIVLGTFDNNEVCKSIISMLEKESAVRRYTGGITQIWHAGCKIVSHVKY